MTKKRIVGFVLIVVSLGTLGFWEFWGRESFSYEKILVFSQDIGRNTTVTKDMIEIKSVENPPEGSLGPADLPLILGLETIQYVPAGTGLFQEFFQEPVFSVGKGTGQYILSIPNQWLKSYPQTLRRGDEVFFYCEGEFVTSAVVAYARDSSNQEVNDLDDARLRATSTVSLVEVVVDEKKTLQLGELADAGQQFVLLYQ